MGQIKMLSDVQLYRQQFSSRIDRRTERMAGGCSMGDTLRLMSISLTNESLYHPGNHISCRPIGVSDLAHINCDRKLIQAGRRLGSLAAMTS